MLFETIEPFLTTVMKPARYVGGELNITRKDPDAQRVRVCLAFPDIYDIGQSYMGFDILYHILNRRPGTLCERTFAPWTDMEEVMRREGIPLWSLESFLPLASFDVIGFTLQYELHYTTVLNMLDLAGVPLFAHERGEEMPLVIGGGTGAVNPEPVASFFDAFLLGDGEEAFPEILDVIENAKASGASRADTLIALAGIDGVYVPSLYREIRDENGSFAGIEPLSDKAAMPVVSRIVEEMKAEYYPDKPLVPLCDIVHDRLAVEIMRGCTRGCRFCGAGMTYRPKRQRPVAEVVAQIEKGIASTGWESVSLVSLSNTDYDGIEELVRQLGLRLRDRNVTISLSSLRADNFSLAIAGAVAGGKRTSLTFAVEAATQRLRDVINKNLTEEQLFDTISAALSAGWKGCKLYFMIGLPTETDEDVIAIADLLNRLNRLLKEHQGRRISVTVSPFCPKPSTPFQREPQISAPEIKRKLGLIRQHLRGRSIQIRDNAPESSLLEGILGRGGRDMDRVILTAWKSGSRLDGWSEHFDAVIWREALAGAGISLDEGTGAIDRDTTLPWGHLSFGVDETYLAAEHDRAMTAAVTGDCRDTCRHCGPYAPFCAALKAKRTAPAPSPGGAPEQRRESDRDRLAYGRKLRKVAVKSIPTGVYGSRVRVKFAKSGVARYTGHLDLVRIFDRVLRRAGIPVAYSQGFHPHPKISFGPTLPLGMTSIAEYVDFSLRDQCTGIEQALQRGFPEGFTLLGLRSIPDKAPSLNAIITHAAYRVDGPVDDHVRERIGEFLTATSIPARRWTKKGPKTVDIRPGTIELTVSDDGSALIMLLSQDQETFVKPAEVLAFLTGIEDSRGITRLEQYVAFDGGRKTPFDAPG